MKPIFEESFVMLTLIVNETAAKKATHENPGGVKILAHLGGEKAGLPFYAVVDAKGQKVADANQMPKNGNIGYPATAEEIVAFEKFLKASAPNMKPDKLARVVEHLKKVAPKLQ